MQLSVGDGFKFGCGLFLAALAFVFGAVILATVVLLVATVLNLPVPFLPLRS